MEYQYRLSRTSVNSGTGHVKGLLLSEQGNPLYRQLGQFVLFKLGKSTPHRQQSETTSFNR